MLRNSRFFEKKQGFKAVPTAENERGSAIIWIFIMIALFAALSFVLSDGSKSGEGMIGKEQADLAATEIIDYASAIKRAVQELQINGCSDTEISFENNMCERFTNPNAPSDESCHLFKKNGAGFRYVAPSKKWLENSQSTELEFANWVVPNDLQVLNIGTQPNAELILTLPYLKKDICLSLNKKFNVENPLAMHHKKMVLFIVT